VACQPTPIRALVVDYGEVLCHPADPERLEEMAGYAGVPLTPFLGAYWELREPYDRGILDGPAYWSSVGAATGTRLDAERIRGLVERDIALWTNLDEEMVSWVEAVAGRGVRVGLLSNMVPEIGAYVRDTLGFHRGFTDVTYSFEVGLVKPEPEIYRRALAGLAAAPQETLFVDDRPPNVEGARAVGMYAHLFRGRDELLSAIERCYALGR